MVLHPIAITIDNNYVQHSCVMLRSLDAYIKTPVDVYCVFNDLSDQSIRRMHKEFKNTQIHLHFIQFDSSVLPELPIKLNDHVTSATFFRIWLPHLLRNVKQVLFMDSDIIVNGDISEILKLDIKNYPLAAVPDVEIFNEKKAKLGMASNDVYINCGVLLLNLEYFRDNELTEKITDFIIKYPELCQFWDQDAINAIIKGNFYKLDYKFNIQGGCYKNEDPLMLTEIENSVVLHYTGCSKPWHYKNTHPERGLYYKYLRLTSFRFYYPPDLPRKWRLFRKLRFMFFLPRK